MYVIPTETGRQTMKKTPQKKPKYCRTISAEYLGVSPATLKKLPIPFVQYSHFGYALYKKSDLDSYKESKTFTPERKALPTLESSTQKSPSRESAKA